MTLITDGGIKFIIESTLSVHPAVAVAAFGIIATDAATQADPNCEIGGFFLEKLFGKKPAKVITNSIHPSGDNSYSWARTALLTLDEDAIKEFLPFKFRDLYFAEYSQIKPKI